MFAVLLIGSVSALDYMRDAKINQDYTILQSCSDATWVNVSVSNLEGNVFVNKPMVLNGTQWEYNFTPTELGRHDATYIMDGCEQTQASYFMVTLSGIPTSDSKAYVNIILLIFFITLIGTFYYVTKGINYEKWHESIIRKYEYKNYMRVLVSSIGYNVMKNKFIWYYLMGLPIMIIITDMVYTFNISSMIELLKVLLAIYYWGFILVGVFFFGFVLEWLAKIIDEIKSIDFGV